MIPILSWKNRSKSPAIHYCTLYTFGVNSNEKWSDEAGAQILVDTQNSVVPRVGVHQQQSSTYSISIGCPPILHCFCTYSILSTNLSFSFESAQKGITMSQCVGMTNIGIAWRGNMVLCCGVALYGTLVVIFSWQFLYVDCYLSRYQGWPAVQTMGLQLVAVY